MGFGRGRLNSPQAREHIFPLNWINYDDVLIIASSWQAWTAGTEKIGQWMQLDTGMLVCAKNVCYFWSI